MSVLSEEALINERKGRFRGYEGWEDDFLDVAIWGGINPDEICGTLPVELEAFLQQSYKIQAGEQSSAELNIGSQAITRPKIALLRPLLLCDEASALHTETVTDSTTKHSTTSIFKSATIHTGSFFFTQDDATRSDDEDICTNDDMRCFLSALARVPDRLTIDESPAIVSAWLNMAEVEHLEAKSLEIKIHEAELFMESEYLWLGSIIQRSGTLRELTLHLPFLDVPQNFWDSLANSSHIQTLHLFIDEGMPQALCDHLANSIHLQSLHLEFDKAIQLDVYFAKIFSSEHGDGALEILLQNPQNRLKELNVTAELRRHHVMTLAQLLPASRLEKIDLNENDSEPSLFLEFFRQIPRMHSLTTVNLGVIGWWEYSLETREECGAALLHALIENPSIQDVGKWSLKHFPQYPLLRHYLSLNRDGRRILTSSQEQPIPDGLWPLILSRAGRNRKPSIKPILARGVTSIPIDHENKNVPANAVYFFLQNSNVLECIHSHWCK